METKDRKQLDSLLTDLAVDQLDPVDTGKLRDILKENPEAVDVYLEHSTLEAWLRSDEWIAEPVDGKIVSLSEGPVFDQAAGTKSRPYGAVAAIAAVLIAMAAFAFWKSGDEGAERSSALALAKPETKRPKKSVVAQKEIYPLSDKHPALSGNGNVRGGVPEEIDHLPETVGYNRHVRALLSENCFFCHGPDGNKRKAELRLDQREGALDSIQPGSPEESELVARLFSTDPDEMMPPPDSGRHLTDNDRKLLKRWVEQGAEYEEHWALVGPVEKKFESPGKDQWPTNGIDFFVKANLDAEGLHPSPEAEKATLIRRISLDLTGLAPTPAEVKAFVKDEGEGAYEKLVDRLLASNHYGEQMALPWLDATRYADSNGFQQDGDRHSYIWRDWVVKAYNDNMPFDQFTIEQLAGDLLENPTQSQLIATSFNRNHMLNGEGGAIAEEQRNNVVFDRVDTVSTIWLGLTLACSQCHDHKYDPLSQKEYYQFFAYFNNMPETGKVDTRLGRLQYGKPVLKIASAEQEANEKQMVKDQGKNKGIITKAKAEIDKAAEAWWDAGVDPKKVQTKLKPVIGRKFATLDGYNDRYVREEFLRQTSNAGWKKAQTEVDRLTKALEKLRNEMKTVMVAEERADIRPTHILDRGDYESPLDQVQPGIPAALHELPEGAPANRLGLAKWLVSPENSLTARVIVNRYWQQFFGIGLVKTTEDFGVQGEDPSHPELLDWLAVEFVRSGWDVKHLHRLIVTSSTYRQSSRFTDELRKSDPENRMLARGARFRLPSMVIRDQALQFAGLLKPEVGGEPVYPYQPEGLWHEFSYEKFRYTPDHGDKLYRRSLYTFWRRTVGPPNTFDAANRQVCMVRSKRTNTPLHALITLNDPTYVEAARVWAENLASEKLDNPVQFAFRKATGRDGTPEEIATLESARQKALDHFSSHNEEAVKLLAVGEYPKKKDLDPVEVASLTHLTQLILNLDEVLNRE